MSGVTAEQLLQDPSDQGTGLGTDGPSLKPSPGGVEPKHLSSL